jgi:hypothetical protein
MPYDFINQNIVASCLIQPHDDDSFYNPVRNLHTGFAFDGNHYTLGVQDGPASVWVANGGNLRATWWSEAQSGNPYRGDQQNFPTYGIVLLSPVSLAILDQSTPVSVATALPLWMQFLLGDTNALANDFNGAIQGFLPSGVCYADGIISVTYSPDSGNQASYTYPAWDAATAYTPGTPLGTGWVNGSIVTYNGVRYQAIPSVPSLASQVVEVNTGSPPADVVTLTVSAGSWAVGQQASLAGLNAATWLNGQTVALIAGTTTTSLVFVDPTSHGAFGPAAETAGTATVVNVGFPPASNLSLWVVEITKPYPAPYPTIGANSNMVISIDFAQDTAYLDVAV